MDARTAALCEELDQLLAAFEKWRKPLVKFQAENLPRLNRDGYTWDMFEAGLKELDARLKSEHDPHVELNRLIEEVCLIYLGADASQRGEIRTYVAQRRELGSLAWAFANRVAVTRIHSPQDAAQVKLGLAAIAIENCGSDYRDTLMSLADLYVRAEEVGLDPKPIFGAVAELSTTEKTRGGLESLAQTMREFENYAVLAERRARKKSY